MPIPVRFRFRRGNRLEGFLRRLQTTTQLAVDRAAKEAADFTHRGAKRRSPRDTGQLALAWFTVRRGHGRYEVFNPLRYAAVAEYGGWPVRKDTGSGPGFVRGRGRLSGFPPGPRTARPTQVSDLIGKSVPFGRPFNPNVSRQARRGMLRITLRDLDKGRYERILLKHLGRAIRRAGGRPL